MAEVNEHRVYLVKSSDAEDVANQICVCVIPVDSRGDALNPQIQKELEKDGSLLQCMHKYAKSIHKFSWGVFAFGVPKNKARPKAMFYVCPVIKNGKITEAQVNSMCSILEYHLWSIAPQSPSDEPLGVAVVDAESIGFDSNWQRRLADHIDPGNGIALFDYVPAEAPEGKSADVHQPIPQGE